MTLALNKSLESRWPHRLAVMLVCATFPLIWVGGLVTTYGAGMAVPDWPSTYGYNLFLYPWQTWLAGPFDIFVEHGHRLLGAAVGMLTIALVAVTVRKDSRRWVHYLAFIALGLVLFQGLLGGLRVRMNARTLALLHGCTAPLFFSVAVALAVVTSGRWLNPANNVDARSKKIGRLATLTSALVYLQLLIGAQVRHLPFGGVSPSYFRMIVFFHLVMVAVLVIHIGLLLLRSFRTEKAWSLRRPSSWLLFAIVAQLILGPATWVAKFGYPSWWESATAASYVIQAGGFIPSLIITAHVATGSLILGLSLTLTLRANRLAHGLTNPQTRTERRENSAANGILKMGVVA